MEAAAQPTIHIPDVPACECRLRAERVTTLTDYDGNAGLSVPLFVERTHDGRYLVVPANRQNAVLLFDSSGRFQRVIGRAGQGPLEFRSILAIRRGPADSTYLIDAGNGRLAVLDPRLNPARSAKLPSVGGWFGVLPDGKVLVLGATPLPGSPAEDRIRVFDRTLELLYSFMPAASDRATRAETLRRRLSVSSAGVVAVAHNDRYTLELWSSDGKHLRTLRRTPDWFRPSSASRQQERPPDRFETPRIAADGSIWTISHVADRQWQDARTATRDLYGRPVQGFSPGALDGVWDSVIELIDASAGRLLATLRVDAHLTFVSDDGFAAGYREDEGGNPHIDIWRFALAK